MDAIPFLIREEHCPVYGWFILIAVTKIAVTKINLY